VEPRTQLSILFADIVGSTEIYERLGNEVARETVEKCLTLLRDTVNAFRGKVIKSLGDGILCSFDSQEEAVWAAVRICQKVGNDETAIRIGIHYGDVIEENNDVFGDAVNTAARIAALAKPSEVLISREIGEHLPVIMHRIVQRVPPVSVKGKREPLELFAILTADTKAQEPQFDLDKTITIENLGPSKGDLELTYGSKKITLKPGSELTLGRDPTSGLVVPTEHVSRMHAKIFFRQGKFVLLDQSSNGTYVVPHLSKLHLLREEAILHGSGLIYLGADPDRTHSEPVLYAVPLGAS
jgi:adenylate cyclase